jgi:hypothetical protein
MSESAEPEGVYIEKSDANKLRLLAGFIYDLMPPSKGGLVIKDLLRMASFIEMSLTIAADRPDVLAARAAASIGGQPVPSQANLSDDDKKFLRVIRGIDATGL